MGIDKAFVARDLGSRRFEHTLSRIVPTRGDGWLVGFRDRSEVVFHDHRLGEIRQVDLHVRYEFQGGTELSLSPDERFFAFASREELRIADSRGRPIHRLPHDAWESYCGSGCLFDRKGRLWCVLPGDDRGSDDRLTIIDPASGGIVAQGVIQNGMGYFGFYASPDEDAVLIECACGQDGSDLYLARLNGSEIAIAKFDYSDRSFSGGFSPSGTEFVTGAQWGDSLKVHSFPDGRELASLADEAIFGDDPLVCEQPDSIGYEAIYLDDGHILARTTFGRLLLIERFGMRLLGTVWADGERLRGYDDRGKETEEPGAIIDYETGLRDFRPAGPGEVLVAYQGNTLRLLDVAPFMIGG
jgi:hypothetical protein